MLFNCLQKIIQRGNETHVEFNLTDALECMIEQDAKFKSFRVQNWYDCGKKESLLQSNATLLRKMGGKVSGQERFENTIIIPPVSIGEGCEIKNSVIGPNVAIGEHTVLNYTIVKDSIIGSFSKLYDVVLDDSLIGSDTGIKGETRSLNIGDDTDIDLG
jgi:glucose-1-phosphate thymidylyltransferase